MKPDEFDLQLMDEMSQLPPPAPEVHNYTPWQASIRKIIWGMVLVTFRFEFFYLQYLRPCWEPLCSIWATVPCGKATLGLLCAGACPPFC